MRTVPRPSPLDIHIIPHFGINVNRQNRQSFAQKNVEGIQNAQKWRASNDDAPPKEKRKGRVISRPFSSLF